MPGRLSKREVKWRKTKRVQTQVIGTNGNDKNRRFEGEKYQSVSIQLLSRVRLSDPMDCNMPGFLIRHQHLELAQTHVCWVNDAIQPSHPLLPPSLLTLNLCLGLKIKLTKINRRKQTNLLQFSVPLEPSLGNEHVKKQWPLNTFTLALVKTDVVENAVGQRVWVRVTWWDLSVWLLLGAHLPPWGCSFLWVQGGHLAPEGFLTASGRKCCTCHFSNCFPLK